MNEARKVRLAANTKQNVAGQSDDLRNDIENLTKMKDQPNQDNDQQVKANDELVSSNETIQINFGTGKRSMFVIAKEDEGEGEVTESQTDQEFTGNDDPKIQRSNSDISENLDDTRTHIDDNSSFLNKYRSSNSHHENRSKAPGRSRSRSPKRADLRRNSHDHAQRSPQRGNTFSQRKAFENNRGNSFNHYPRNNFGDHRGNRGRGRDRHPPPNNHNERGADRRRSSNSQDQQRLLSPSLEVKKIVSSEYPTGQDKKNEEEDEKKEEIKQIDLRLEMKQQLRKKTTSPDEATSPLESASINRAIHALESPVPSKSKMSQALQWQPTPSSKLLQNATTATKLQKVETTLKNSVTKVATVQQDPTPEKAVDKGESTTGESATTSRVVKTQKIKEEPPKVLIDIDKGNDKSKKINNKKEVEENGESTQSSSSEEEESDTDDARSKKKSKKNSKKKRRNYSESDDSSSDDSESENERERRRKYKRKKSKSSRKKKEKRSKKKKQKHRKKSKSGEEKTVMTNEELAAMKEKMKEEILKEIQQKLPTAATATSSDKSIEKQDAVVSNENKSSSDTHDDDDDSLELDYSSEEPYDEHGFHTGVTQKKDASQTGDEPAAIKKEDAVIEMLEDAAVDDLDYDLDDTTEEDNWKRQKKDEDEKRTQETKSSSTRREPSSSHRRRSGVAAYDRRNDFGSRDRRRREWNKESTKKTQRDERRETTRNSDASRYSSSRRSAITIKRSRSRSRERASVKDTARKPEYQTLRQSYSHRDRDTASASSSKIRENESRHTPNSRRDSPKSPTTKEQQESAANTIKSISRTSSTTTAGPTRSPTHQRGRKEIETAPLKDSATSSQRHILNNSEKKLTETTTKYQERNVDEQRPLRQATPPLTATTTTTTAIMTSKSTPTFRSVDNTNISTTPTDGIAIAQEVREDVYKLDTFWKGSVFKPRSNVLESASSPAEHVSDAVGGGERSIGDRLLKIADQQPTAVTSFSRNSRHDNVYERHSLTKSNSTEYER